jgi:hypothetical protein
VEDVEVHSTNRIGKLLSGLNVYQLASPFKENEDYLQDDVIGNLKSYIIEIMIKGYGSFTYEFISFTVSQLHRNRFMTCT